MGGMAIHSHFLHNGEIKNSSAPSLNPGQLGLLSGWGVFSTLRVADGGLFAWDRHWARMSRDARLLNVAMPADRDLVEADLLRLLEANAANNSTLRIAVVRNGGGLWQGASLSPRPQSRGVKASGSRSSRMAGSPRVNSPPPRFCRGRRTCAGWNAPRNRVSTK
jgi:branched-subunit amino acid aminotransferase/4-amino-4-deoxychorismate lyase